MTLINILMSFYEDKGRGRRCRIQVEEEKICLCFRV
jgi:hypothetical protein